MNSKNLLIFFLGLFGVLLAVFGLQIYTDLAPRMVASSEIIISESNGEHANEKILTVDVGKNNVVLYSFDGGETYQTQNTFAVSENKTVKIVLKDNEKRVVGRKDYEVKVVSSDGPTITISNMPNTIYVGSNIDLNSYAKAVDSNNNPVNITINSNGFDSNKPGTYHITYTAIDSNNLKAELTVEISVIAKANNNTNPTPSATPSNDPIPTPSTSPTPSATPTPTPSNSPKPSEKPKEKQKVTYYRYRTKSTLIYDCNYYDCNYLDYNDTAEGTYTFGKDSYCCNTGDCPLTMPQIDAYDLCILNGGGCIPRGEVKVPAYMAEKNICFDKMPILLQPSANNGNELAPVQFKSACDNNEYSSNGRCYRIHSYGTAACPTGYVLENGNCYKEIKRTCNNHCTSESWSPWSEWSTTKVIASDSTEVQTKVETIER